MRLSIEVDTADKRITLDEVTAAIRAGLARLERPCSPSRSHSLPILSVASDRRPLWIGKLRIEPEPTEVA
jgi:hypothetical protein